MKELKSSRLKLLLYAIESLVGVGIIYKILTIDDPMNIAKIIFIVIGILWSLFFIRFLNPSKVTMDERGIYYIPTFGEKRRVEFTQFEEVYNHNFKISVYLIPIFGFSNCKIIYIDKGKKKRIPMFTFETKDMDILRNRALNRMEQLEMQQSGAGDELGYAYGNTQQVYTNTGYSHFLGIEESGFGRQNCQFQLPQAKLRNSYVKATFISCLIAVAVCLFFGVVGMLYTQSASETGMQLQAMQMAMICACLLCLFLLFYYKNRLESRKYVPGMINLLEEYMEIDGMRYFWREMQNAVLVNPNANKEKKIKFSYYGKDYRYHFGEQGMIVKSNCKEYKEIAGYCLNKGFVERDRVY